VEQGAFWKREREGAREILAELGVEPGLATDAKQNNQMP
jgi:hypothetical protein